MIVEPTSSYHQSWEPLERIQVVSIQFNSLDVIANQETIIELLSFGRRIIPETIDDIETVSGRKRRKATKEVSCQTEEIWDHPLNESLMNLSSFVYETKKEDQRIETRTEITADFQRLNVLLLRAGTGKMIGTALLTEARVHSTFGQTVNVSGSLGGLQINSLLPGSQLHQRIVSVGKDPSCLESSKARSNIHSDLYGRDSIEASDDGKQAFTFTMRQNYIDKGELSTLTPMQESHFESYHHVKRTQKISIELRMASVTYLHSPPFLKELNSCASDFLHFLSKLASSIKLAATDLALGIVQRRTESIGHQAAMEEMYWTPLKQDKYDSMRSYDQYGSLERGVKLPAPASTPMVKTSSPLDNLEISVDAVLETPILVLPRHEHSSEVLVAHLGAFVIRNELIDSSTDRVLINVSKMNVCTLDLLAQIQAKCNTPLQNRSSFKDKGKVDMLEVVAMSKTLPTEELYSSSSELAYPILHDTEISLSIDRSKLSMKHSESLMSSCDDAELPTTLAYDLRGQVMNPLKVSVCRSQYEQFMDSMGNLTSESQVEEEVTSNPTNENAINEATEKTHTSTTVEGSFGVSDLVFELVGEGLGSGRGHPLVNVQLSQFAVNYTKKEDNENCTEITLGSIVIEDLSLSKDSPHRTLATSISDVKDNAPLNKMANRSMSSSCPYLNVASSAQISEPQNIGAHSSSLPNRLDTRCVFDNLSGTKNNLLAPPHPATPPPSVADESESMPTPEFEFSTSAPPTNRWQKRDDNLVHVRIESLHPKSSRWDGTHRFIDVDFNTLNIIFNLKSWVMIFDFFGIGSPKVEKAKSVDSSRKMPSSRSYHAKQEVHQPTHINSEIDVKVKQLSVILNHSNYEVAHASVKKFVSRMSLRQGNFAINGTLGKFLVLDLTSQGSLYRDRFLSTHGHDTMLYFDFFKYGDPNEAAKQPHDATLKIRMASVIYVHTQRFYSELTAFFNNFHQHQNVMNRIREAAMGSSVSEVASRGTRVHLDIEAGSPLLLLPVSSSSNRLLVVNLGFLEASNTFKFSGDEGTISSQTLRSALASQLVSNRRRRSTSRSSRASRRSSRSRRSGLKSPASNVSSTHHSRSRGRQRVTSASEEEEDRDDFFEENITKPVQCLLDVLNIRLTSMDIRTADRLSAFSEDINADDILVGGFIVRQHKNDLLREKCELQLQIERNLDSALNHNVPDISLNGELSKMHATIDDYQYRMIRGLLAYNMGENLDDLLQFRVVQTNEYQDPAMQTVLTGITWTCMYINLQLHDVTLDLRKSNQRDTTFARVNFAKSLLTYESFR